MNKEALLQYNIRHDRSEKDARFIAKHLETHLKERFNVLLSTVEYGIDNGHLVREGKSEPFIESIKRGRDVIQSISPDSFDFDRENAEPIGFEKIDTFLSNPETPLGSKMLSISPKGEKDSKYQHNFYDIFTLEERDGKKYVELRRYSSALSRKDYAGRFGFNQDNPPTAAEFLENPIKIGADISADEIHESLHVTHDYMIPVEFERIWNSSLVQFFVKRYQLDRSARSFNAILNAADEVWQNKEKEDGKYQFIARNTISYEHVRILEEKQVRQAGGQCPGKSGADTDNSPFSVSEFDFGYKFDKAGPCMQCNADVNCGPCGLCKDCDLAIRASQNNNLN